MSEHSSCSIYQSTFAIISIVNLSHCGRYAQYPSDAPLISLTIYDTRPFSNVYDQLDIFFLQSLSILSFFLLSTYLYRSYLYSYLYIYIWSFIIYVCLLTCVLCLFPLLMVSFDKQLNFIQSNPSVFTIMFRTFCVLKKKFPILKHLKIFFHIIFQRLYCFAFYFEFHNLADLLFVYGMRQKSFPCFSLWVFIDPGPFI